MGSDIFALPEKEHSHSWCCRACTFRNHDLLTRCEICDQEKCAPGTAKESANVQLDQQTLGKDWPELSEAWTLAADCDVASTASSWLDVGAVLHADAEDDTFVVVDDCSKSEAEAKPILWSAIVR